MPSETDGSEAPDLEELLGFLKRTRNFDFHAYKRPTLTRRIERRMSLVGAPTYSEYQSYLQTEPTEFAQLFNTVLINVTNFFRDDVPWDFLASDVLPKILEEKHPREPIRVWSAGCATGQEAYTVAMVLAEAMGVDEFQSRVKIYATDIDEDALQTARHALYPAKEVAQVPDPLLIRYFENVSGGYAFRKDLRRTVIFGRHDLLQDAPISRIDILVCRNTLMYFNTAAQARILARFHFALTDRGFLFLGRAETLLAHGNTFGVYDLKRRVFQKIGHTHFQGGRLALVPAGESERASVGARTIDVGWQAAFDAAALPQILVDRTGNLAFANEAARDLFRLLPASINRPFHDLELSYRPVELRSLITKAHVERRRIGVRSVEWTRGTNDSRWLEAQITPLYGAAGESLGTTVAFMDITEQQRLQHQLELSTLQLQSAYQQLQSANEELETTNEELQSTVEELETTNEELQSTNEELETMNEELQSTNEELTAVNDMARQYTGELDIANELLQSISAGLGHRIIVLDRNLRIKLWNEGVRDLLGIGFAETVDQRLSQLDSGLPVQEMVAAATQVMNDGDGPLVKRVRVTNRRGRPVDIDLTVAALPDVDGGTVAGIILMMEDAHDLEVAGEQES